MVEPVPLLYSSREEIAAIFSDQAIDLRIDDDADNSIATSEEDFIQAAIEEATDETNQYLLHRYDAVDLVESRWVRRQTSYIAAHILSRRRGNASQYAAEAAMAQAKLQEILDGVKFVPRIAPNANYLPSVGNLRIDYRYPRATQRVDTITSTGDGYPEMHADYYLGIGDWWQW